uniref:tRNA (guanine(10)-N(2))-methyltransferase n=1 Tax=Coccidioides posadasii RMSCC 3488 TaxID=454284 RepID=A0A0J6EW91_COCPO|nr:RNA methylase family protein [Coccidioides posadasii RMSCC 3488]
MDAATQPFQARTHLERRNLGEALHGNMEYLVRFAQVHESFRRSEIEALAIVSNVDLEIVEYDEESPFCIIKVPDEKAARALVSRSVLVKSLYELWGKGQNYQELHEDVRRRSESKWPDYRTCSFKFDFDSYAGKRTSKEKIPLIQSFGYMAFEGPIIMADPDETFIIFELYDHRVASSRDKTSRTPSPQPEPSKLYFGRWLASGSRDVMDKYDLKKRSYISTTSMDAELSLVSANITLAAPGKVFYDPFVGTGSFCVAAAHFGAFTFGSDIDARSFKGQKEEGRPIGLVRNMLQYGLEANYLDAFTSDLTNTPFRNMPIFDGIICDPPYGIREGLKVLGTREGKNVGPVYVDGVPTYTFEAMLNDILEFAAQTLVPNGRISFWMPTANDEDIELAIPSNPHLELVSVCVQQFNKWSRRLLTYRRCLEGEASAIEPRAKTVPAGTTADELNSFRKRLFNPLRGNLKAHRDTTLKVIECLEGI